MIRNLVLAYVATWVVHLGYIVFLLSKGAELRREEKELNLQSEKQK